MRVIIDKHVLLWLVDTPDKLPTNVISFCENKNNRFFISIASFWELSIKMSLGKIELADNALTILKTGVMKSS